MTTDRARVTDEDTRRVWQVAPGPQERSPRAFARRRKLERRLLGVLVPVVLLVAWELSASAGLIDERFFPAPSQIGATGLDMASDGTLLADLTVTVRVLAIGLIAGFVVGAIAGLLLGLSRIARAALEPLLSALYTIPKLAVLPLLLLLFGVGELPKVILVALGVFFISWISVLEAILDLPSAYREAAAAFGVTGWRRMRHVTLPAVLPQVLVGLRISVGNAVLIVVGVEFVSGDEGIGYRIWNSWSIFAADRMYVGIVVVALLGYLLALLVQLLSRICVPWAPRTAARRD